MGLRSLDSSSFLTYLFVDDVLIMTRARVSEWKEIESILSCFLQSVRSSHKSSQIVFPFLWLKDFELTSFKAIFPYKFVDLNEGFRYLGFFLKPANYRVEDWRWLIIKFEKRIGLWCHHWLTLGGRFVLVKAVLESLPMFWLAVAIIPISVLNIIHN
jgi:hypothetical protein